ncbi:MAG: hypothetical protein AAFX02_05640 [Pseudomonadota bacterium]
MSQTRASKIDIGHTIQSAYAFMRGAIVPTILGTLMFAITSTLAALIQKYQWLGDASAPSAICLYGVTALSWFSMTLRRGTGQPEKGIFGMSFGADELRLGASTGLVLIALGLVAFFIGFALFIIIMSTFAIDSGIVFQALPEDVEREELLSQYFDEFSLGETSLAARAIVTLTSLLGIGGFLWLVVRVLPYAPGVIAMKQVTALQAIAWTQYHGRGLFAAFLGTLGLALAIAVGVQWGLSVSGVSDVPVMLISHLFGCFAALIGVGYVSSAYRQLAASS